MVHYKLSSQPVIDAATLLADTIRQKLTEGQPVLWLASGGSGINVGVELSRQLNDEDLTNLSIALTDERYGPLNHPDENWQQLLDAGATFAGADSYRIIENEDIATTTKDFAAWLQQRLDTYPHVVGLFGIGEDGHTAGIKPGSIATTSPDMTAYFTGDDFQRITITPRVFPLIDEAVIQAAGNNKHTILQAIFATDSPTDYPAALLKDIPSVTLITDQQLEV